MASSNPFTPNNNMVFSFGSTEAKMDMSLDTIIKQDKSKRRTKPRQAPTKPSNSQRKKELARNVSQRAQSIRKNKVEKMRGIEPTSAPKEENKNKNRRNTPRAGKPMDFAWLKQQRERNNQRRRKLQMYSKNVSGGHANGNSNGRANRDKKGPSLQISFDASNNKGKRTEKKPFHFEAPSSTITFSARPSSNNNNDSRKIVRKGRGETRARINDKPAKTISNDNRRVNFQNRQARSVSEKRGIQSTTGGSSTLNERFGQTATERSSKGGSGRNTRNTRNTTSGRTITFNNRRS